MALTTALPELSVQEARKAVFNLSLGEPPPPELIGYLSVGLERDLAVFDREFFSPDSFVAAQETEASTFKMVEAYYGGGKTHYLRAIEAAAHGRGFASAFVSLKKDECPLTRFDLIYSAVATGITVSSEKGQVQGFGNLIRSWVDAAAEGADDILEVVKSRMASVRDLPLMSIKVAVRVAALAHAAGDDEMFDEALVYLTGGGISASLRKEGVLDRIDKTNGSLALRSVVGWIRDAGYAGFIFILDEGDRSLSLVAAKDKKAASNNLVQLINEAASEGAWPSTVLLYSIPSWDAFEAAFGHNEALIGRTRSTGFPLVPPAPRVVLDQRYRTDRDKVDFCAALAPRLATLFAAAYSDFSVTDADIDALARKVARAVVDVELTPTFRRLFVQSFLTALYPLLNGDMLDDGQIEQIVRGQTDQLSREG